MVHQPIIKISSIIRKHPHHYILVDVFNEDKITNTPLLGQLLACSRNKTAIYKKLHTYKDWQRPIYICYTDALPIGTKAALSS